jgi:hypothetical protein
MRFISWDIETDTSGGFGLDPNHGGIVSIAAAVYDVVDNQLVEGAVFYMQVGGEVTELLLLAAFNSFLLHQRIHGVANLLVGWNSTCFDAPFVQRRSEVVGANLDLFLRFNPRITPKYEATPGFAGGYDHLWWGHKSVDIAFDSYGEKWCEREMTKWSLKPVAEHMGIEMVNVDRERIHLLTDDELKAYNLSDVRGTASLYALSRGAKPLPQPAA